MPFAEYLLRFFCVALSAQEDLKANLGPLKACMLYGLTTRWHSFALSLHQITSCVINCGGHQTSTASIESTVSTDVQ